MKIIADKIRLYLKRRKPWLTIEMSGPGMTPSVHLNSNRRQLSMRLQSWPDGSDQSHAQAECFLLAAYYHLEPRVGVQDLRIFKDDGMRKPLPPGVGRPITPERLR